MQLTLNPIELEQLSKQILAGLLPELQKSLVSNAKAASGHVHCLTVADAAKRLKCVTKTVLKYIGDGRLKAANLGTFERPQYRISENDFAEFYKVYSR